MAMRNLSGVFKIPPRWITANASLCGVKLTKKFTKKVCSEIGKKMTWF